MTRIITVKAPPVKTWPAPRKPRPFGRGILPTPAAVYFNEAMWVDVDCSTAEDRHLDEMGELAMAQDRLDRGLCF